MIARYEELRQQVLGRPHAIARGQGLALLMRGGMGGWMQAWAPCVVEVPTPPKQRLSEENGFPLELHREVTLIVAAMVLNRCQETIA